MDPSTHPPKVSAVDYLLDGPRTDELIQSFPIVLVSQQLGAQLVEQGFTGLRLARATVRPSEEYLAAYGRAPHRQYAWLQVVGAAGETDCWIDDEFLLCVSERMMAVIETAELHDCDVIEFQEVSGVVSAQIRPPGCRPIRHQPAAQVPRASSERADL